jgi:MFS family permease
MFTLAVNQLISFRDHLVIDVENDTPDSVASLAVSIFQGIGFVIIGNLYDNVLMPRRLTIIIMLILSVLTALCAAVPAEIARDDSGYLNDQKYNQLLI